MVGILRIEIKMLHKASCLLLISLMCGCTHQVIKEEFGLPTHTKKIRSKNMEVKLNYILQADDGSEVTVTEKE